MRVRFIIILIIPILALFSVPSDSAAGDLIEEVDAFGKINWSAGFLEAKGYHKTTDRKTDGAMNWEKAILEAKNNAWDHLLKTVESVRIQGEMNISEIEDDEIIMGKIMGMVKNSAVTDLEYGTEGRVAITLGLSFFGGFSQLVLPLDIENVEPISLNNNPENKGEPDSSFPPKKQNKTKIFSGLIVDARGLGAMPAMMLKILNENGDEIYGPAFVSREVAVQNGMCLYDVDIVSSGTNKRVSDHPLIIKALNTKHVKGSDLVISNADALKIKSSSEHLEFLRQCRVIIILDQQDNS